jgi:hypothetical protein
MQAGMKIRFTLARMPSKNFIYFKVRKDPNHGVYGELPILSYDIKVEHARPDVSALRQAPFVARPQLRNPMLVFGEPKVVFERVI